MNLPELVAHVSRLCFCWTLKYFVLRHPVLHVWDLVKAVVSLYVYIYAFVIGVTPSLIWVDLVIEPWTYTSMERHKKCSSVDARNTALRPCRICKICRLAIWKGCSCKAKDCHESKFAQQDHPRSDYLYVKKIHQRWGLWLGGFLSQEMSSVTSTNSEANRISRVSHNSTWRPCRENIETLASTSRVRSTPRMH